MKVSVIYATAALQAVRQVQLPEGARLRAAVEASGLLEAFPEIDLARADRLGINGRVTAPDTVLKDGDQVEIYRPLQVDPKQARRRRAAARGR